MATVQGNLNSFNNDVINYLGYAINDMNNVLNYEGEVGYNQNLPEMPNLKNVFNQCNRINGELKALESQFKNLKTDIETSVNNNSATANTLPDSQIGARRGMQL